MKAVDRVGLSRSRRALCAAFVGLLAPSGFTLEGMSCG